MRIAPSPTPDESAVPSPETPEAERADPATGRVPEPAGNGTESGTRTGTGTNTGTDSGSGTGDARTFDRALVVVHGMGDAYRSQILLEWAEPLLARMDWLARDKVIGADDRHGVSIEDSDLSGEVPMVTATVRYPGPRAQASGEASDAADDVVLKIAILEARWSESFLPMSRGQVFQWAVVFMWRTIWRVLDLFLGTMVLVPWYTLLRHWTKPAGEPRELPKLVDLAIDVVRLVVCTIAFAVTWVFLVLLAAVLTPILPLISPLLLIPWFKNVAQGVIDGIIESIGDVAVWKEKPLRASAMRLVVRTALERAKELVGDGDVHLFAHSQGAAVATYALFEELVPSTYNVSRLTTVGAAVVLLGRDRWQGRSDEYRPVDTWLERNKAAGAGREVAWVNHWAIWDPFSAGPIADTAPGRRERWRNAYFPGGSTTKGPEEHAVHNTSQPFLDHSVYFENTIQVVEPTARHLLGPGFPDAPAAVAYVENRLSVIDKKSLGINMLAAVVIAAILPGLPGVYAAFATLASWVAGAIGFMIGVFPGGQDVAEAVPAAIASASFVTDPNGLNPWSWLLASVFTLAVLIWLNQRLATVTRRSREWDRCPIEPRHWLVLSSIPRAFYVAGAFVCVWFAIFAWARPSVGWLIVDAVLLAIVAIFVFVEPLYAPVPVVVAARVGDAEAGAPTIVAGSTPMKLRDAVRTEEFRNDLAARRRLLRPEGRRARLWAKWFHGWPESATATATAPGTATANE
ncbi:hypothetical protein ASE14_08525 [Agromyces sp. Root81]|uniref:hypothetical protein n=1 Tax=Agromyces sp. Root81 TaxID=1736601 RepID=UPI0006FC0930|nr:hypothetical protein [Agromyces sp. Root81]KRC60986.1 hypothetical protein ASE14_08525 [Agromyces sp. Root81]